ncbi:MAG: hypothetical protein ACRDDZ_09200 [Marinifilaceae bacterium]
MEPNKLHNPKDKAPFSLPDNYFDTFTDQMMAHVETEEKIQSGFTFNFVALKPYLGLVGMFAIAVLFMQVIMWTVPYFSPQESVYTATASASTFNPSGDEIVDYLIYEMNSNEIMMALLE